VSSEVRIKHLELILGSADDGGGAIRVSWPASLYAHDVTFTANSALRGGAVYVHATFARLDHCLFRRNNASEVGGVAYAEGDIHHAHWIVPWVTNRKLTQADSEAATPAAARTVRGKHAASRLGGISDDATATDCALYTGSGDACWGGDQSVFDDDVLQSIVPGACATCGYGEGAPTGLYNLADACITCADAGYEIVVLWNDCTGICVDAAGKALLEDGGLAGLDDSACAPYRACYDDETFLDTLSLGGTNTNYDFFSYSYDYHRLSRTHKHAPGARLKVTHGTLSENRARAGAAFAAFYAHLEVKHTRAFFEPTWDLPFGDQEIHLMENGTGYGCHNEPHFNFTGNKVGWERCWDSSDEASMLLYKLAILCMVIIAGVAAGGCVIGSMRLTYGYLFQHWKCPDLGALGGRLWYDDHRGECYCGVFFATCFSAIALVFAFLAAGEDPNLIDAFGYARLDSTDPTTYLIIGLNGYVVVADEIGEDDTVADESLDGNKVYVPFGKSFGDDDAAGSDYDWTGMCATAGEQAYGALYPILFVKLAAAFIVYRRVDTEKDSWYWKFAGVGVECLATVLVLNMLVYFSFDCLMQLPTGAFFVPASDDTEAAYAYADDDPGTSYAVDAAYPYTSFIFTIVSGLCSLFVAYVHWRTPTWNSEMVEKLY
jgi:predicted outer membrane repeat protein